MTTALHQRGTGKDFVFQHGLCGDARQTFEATPDLAGWRLTTLDCAGHGAAAAVPPFSIARFADAVIAVIETLPGPVMIGGISMGAAIALRIAVTRPDLIRGLLLVRPAWLTECAPANMQPNQEVGQLMARGQPQSAFAGSATARHLAQVAPDNLTSLLGFFDRAPQAVTAALLCAIATDGPGVSRADLAALRLPARVCGTTRDAVHPLQLARDLAGLIPAARFTELPPKGTDKFAHLATLHHVIRDFLQEF